MHMRSEDAAIKLPRGHGTFAQLELHATIDAISITSAHDTVSAPKRGIGALAFDSAERPPCNIWTLQTLLQTRR